MFFQWTTGMEKTVGFPPSQSWLDMQNFLCSPSTKEPQQAPCLESCRMVCVHVLKAQQGKKKEGSLFFFFFPKKYAELLQLMLDVLVTFQIQKYAIITFLLFCTGKTVKMWQVTNISFPSMRLKCWPVHGKKQWQATKVISFMDHESVRQRAPTPS